MDKKKFYDARKMFDEFQMKRVMTITREFDTEGSTVTLSYFTSSEIHIEILCSSVITESTLSYKTNTRDMDIARLAWFSPVYYLSRYKHISFEKHD